MILRFARATVALLVQPLSYAKIILTLQYEYPDYRAVSLMISIRRALVVLAILAFVVVSTAAVAHGHVDSKSADESHCPLCMAVHTTTRAAITPIAALNFELAQTAFLVHSERFVLPLVHFMLARDRAPPQL